MKIARCPSARDNSLPSFPCSQCEKSFASRRALDRHSKRHATHRHKCRYCHQLCKSERTLRSHEAIHEARNYQFCGTCGDEFAQWALNGHRQRFPDFHVSSRHHLQFSSAEDVNSAFLSPTAINAGSLFHTTSERIASGILERGHFTPQRVHAPHDGVMRRDDAPKVVYFSAEDTLNLVSPYPVHAEPGELGTAISVPMDSLAKRAGGERRLFLVSVSPCETFRGNIPEQAKLRATLLLASEEHWAWCEERRLVELDPFNNSILSCRDMASSLQGPSWEVATQFASREYGTRSVRVVVAVAGYVGTSDEPLDMRQPHKVAHIFRDSDGNVECPACLELFPHEMAVFSHLAIYHSVDHGAAHFDDTSADPLQRDAAVSFSSSPVAFPFECTAASCQKRFKYRSGRRRHESRVHSDEKFFPCRHCDTPFSTRESRRLHDLSAHEGRRFYCAKCPASFLSSANLMTHMRSKHPSIPRGVGGYLRDRNTTEPINIATHAPRPPLDMLDTLQSRPRSQRLASAHG